jgi:hypothetical protein
VLIRNGSGEPPCRYGLVVPSPPKIFNRFRLGSMLLATRHACRDHVSHIMKGIVRLDSFAGHIKF